MDYQTFLAELKTIPCQELRSEKPEFFEMVVKKDVLDQITAILERFFGPAMKPAGKDPSAEARKKAVTCGGIRKEQTLYFAEKDGYAFIAALWPWSNEISITLKITPQTH